MREYDKNSAVDMFNRFSGNFLKSMSEEVRQLPPQIDGLYHNSRTGFPLGFAHASKYVGRGAALIGFVAFETFLVSVVWNIVQLLFS